MKSRTKLWKYLLVTLDWRVPEAGAGEPARIAINEDLTVEVSAEINRSIPAGRYLPIECADGRIEWANVRYKRANADGTVTLHFEPL